MRIFAIETSCDETGVSLLDINKRGYGTHTDIVANELASQAKDHEEYGGIYPTLAKRLHARNFPPLLSELFKDVKTKTVDEVTDEQKQQIREWLDRHPSYANNLMELIANHGVPETDAIAVTYGPGLEPALWVGINTARSLSLITDTPVVPVNHMAGHLISTYVPEGFDNSFTLNPPSLPAVALLVSGGHTELIKVSKDEKPEKIGQTRDDAAGEAFDKVGRALGLSYPAGPAISRLANEIQNSKFKIPNSLSLPRPMINSDNLDFSFSGLKTAAVRLIEEQKPLDEKTRKQIAFELESAIVDVLTTKAKKAANQIQAQTILAGGGVVANPKLREDLSAAADELSASLQLSPLELATDNAVMIGLAGWQKHTNQTDGAFVSSLDKLSADSRLSL